jgi:hypothetical protein
MGALGFLRKFSYSNRGMALPGQALTLRGKVVRKHRLDARHAVDLGVWEENADGQLLVPALATVLLPSRVAA